MTPTDENNVQTAEAVLSDLRYLVEEAEGLVARSNAVAAEDMVAALRDRYEAAQERLQLFATERPARVFRVIRTVDRAIRTSPYHAIGVGLGVGLFFGLLLRRRTP